MSSVPNYVLIGPHCVAVEYVAEIGGDAIGQADFRNGKITICTELASSVAVETILHEVVHLILCGMPLKERDVEYVVNTLGKGLASFIRDNPKWIRRFQEIFVKEENKE